jgi:DNA-binding MarR family transcriptional regulator
MTIQKEPLNFNTFGINAFPMEQLKLDNQICFPFYAISRLITRAYQPYLDVLGITYTQYLVLMVLWETDNISVHEITDKLILNTNTVTPLLKRMATQGIITRNRSDQDERKVIISLTEKGIDMKSKAASIPEALAKSFINEDFSLNQFHELKANLNGIITVLKESELDNSI